MESEATTSQSLGNDAIGALMARIDALARQMEENRNALRSKMVTMTGEISTFSRRLDFFRK